VKVKFQGRSGRSTREALAAGLVNRDIHPQNSNVGTQSSAH